jgi:hypothetical protein
VRLLGVKLFYFLWVRPELGGFYGDQPAAQLGRLAYLVSNALLLPFWLLGLALSLRDGRRHLALYGPLLVALVQNLVYFVGTRFRTPAAPFQILLAAYCLAVLAPWLLGRLSRSRAPAVSPFGDS